MWLPGTLGLQGVSRCCLVLRDSGQPRGAPFPRSGSRGVGGLEAWLGAAVGPCLQWNGTPPPSRLPRASGGCGAERPWRFGFATLECLVVLEAS